MPPLESMVTHDGKFSMNEVHGRYSGIPVCDAACTRSDMDSVAQFLLEKLNMSRTDATA